MLRKYVLPDEFFSVLAKHRAASASSHVKLLTRETRWAGSLRHYMKVLAIAFS